MPVDRKTGDSFLLPHAPRRAKRRGEGRSRRRFRTLVPLASEWTDEVLSGFVLGAEGSNALDEAIEIGSASRRGRSRRGPLVVVPTRVRHRDGKVYEEKFIVQFRGPSDAPSCVLYAPTECRTSFPETTRARPALPVERGRSLYSLDPIRLPA